MLKKTITKFCGFVIFLTTGFGFLSACAFVSSDGEIAAADHRYAPPVVNGNIKSADITESSGLAASRCQNNVLWTHNDSGDEAFIFAINSTGESLGTWKVANSQNIDWEDIAAYKDKAGKCYLYIGEIGDNKAKHSEHIVYRVPEPIVIPANVNSSRREPLATEDAERIRFTYPDFNQDAETLLVHPQTGNIYVVTKRVSGPAGVYRIRTDFGLSSPQKAEKVAELSVPAIPNGFFTGGDISPDGKHLIICDYTRAYEFDLPDSSASFGEIWRQSAVPVELGPRRVGEAVCYSVDGTAIFATSERSNAPLIEVKRR